MKTQFHRIGAIFYLLWALLHVAAGSSLVASALTNINGHLQEIGTGRGAAPPTLADATVVSGIAAFHAFNMVWMGVVVGLSAVLLNWRNSRGGFWLGLVLAGLLDVGLFAFLLVPGYMAWSDGWLGPLLFAGGAIFSALGRLGAREAGVRPGEGSLVGVR